VEIRAHNSIGFSHPSQIIVRTAPTPGGAGTGSYDSITSADAGLDLPVIIVLVALVLLITLILVDVTCYKVNQTGLIYGITHKLCNKKQRPESGPKVTTQEKQPFVEPEETKLPLPTTVIVDEDGGMKATNGNGTKSGRHTSDSSV
jgi:hypothetical protein